MNKYRLGAGPVFFFLLLNLHSDANALVQFPIGPAAWTVNITNSATNQTPLSGTAIVKVEVQQNEKYSSNLVTDGKGRSRVTWGITGTYLLLTEDPKGTAFLTSSSRFFYIPYQSSVFDWLSPELLKEKKPISYGDKSCFHYKTKMPVTPVTDWEHKTIGKWFAEAWIDSKTLRPVALDDGMGLAAFTFQPAPTTPLVVPEKFQKIIDGYTAVWGSPKPQ